MCISKQQLGVSYLSYGWHHLVNAYEGKAGMVYLQVKLCSMPELFGIYIVYKWRYVNILPFLSFNT